jgi:hypothetical protein
MKITNYQPINNPKGSHGLHQDTFKLQTMTALIKSFCGCFTGPDASRGMFHVFSRRVPLAAGGKREVNNG